MKLIKKFFLVATAVLFVNAGFAQTEKTVMVGGAAMYPSKNIVENAVNSKDHTTLVAAVKAAGLVETLQSAGPFTVFAPTNEAFTTFLTANGPEPCNVVEIGRASCRERVW